MSPYNETTISKEILMKIGFVITEPLNICQYVVASLTLG